MRVRFIAVWSRIAIGRIRSFQKGTRDVATIRKWTGRESRALREAMRLSIRDFADQLGVTARSISKWEAGGPHFVQRPESQEILDTKLRQVSDEVRARFELILGTPPENSGDDLDQIPRSKLPGVSVIAGTATAQAEKAEYSATAEVNNEDSGMTGIEEDMERRRLLQGLVALGAEISPLSQALDTVRSAFGGTVGYDDRSHLGDWEETVADYGYSYMSTSPLRLIPDLAADLVSVRSIVRRIPRDSLEYRSWCRVSGVLSGFVAKSLSNLGQSRDSRQWWNMAQHVTDESGDLGLSLWVRGQRIIHGLYENRPFPILLRQVESSKEFSRDHPCAGLASISVGHAQLSVLSGDNDSAERELHRASEILDCLPSCITDDGGSVMSWGEAQLRYSEAWVYSHIGNEAKTDRAIERALQLYPDTDTRSPAQIKLMQAFARVQAGNISEGMRRARAVYESLISEQRTTMVDVLARRVLHSVPHEAQNCPDVTEYRALVAQPMIRAIES